MMKWKGFLVVAMSSFSLLHAGEVLARSHDCNACHSVHGNGSALVPAMEETLCLACHGPGGYATRASSHRTSEDSEYGKWSANCFDCHDPHEDYLPNRFDRSNLSFVGNDLYDDAVASILFRTDSDPAGLAIPVVFESRGSDAGGPSLYSFADNDEDGDGVIDSICAVCHSQTKYFLADGGGETGHHVGETCTSKCHLHSRGFIRKK